MKNELKFSKSSVKYYSDSMRGLFEVSTSCSDAQFKVVNLNLGICYDQFSALTCGSHWNSYVGQALLQKQTTVKSG